MFETYNLKLNDYNLTKKGKRMEFSLCIDSTMGIIGSIIKKIYYNYRII